MVDRWPHVQMIVHVRQNYFLSRLPKEIRESVMANGTSRLIEQLRVNEIVAVRKNHEIDPADASPSVLFPNLHVHGTDHILAAQSKLRCLFRVAATQAQAAFRDFLCR